MEDNKISYKFFETGQVPDKYLQQIWQLGQAYERDIGGLDLGFGGVWGTSQYVLSVLDEDDKIVGFLTGSNVDLSQPLEGEKMMYVSAAYLEPYYRNSGGKHTGILNSALEALVDTLDTEGFDRLRIFPPGPFCSMLVTTIGHEQVLQPLYEILSTRESSTGSLVGDAYELQYLFNADDFIGRIESSKRQIDSNKFQFLNFIKNIYSRFK